MKQPQLLTLQNMYSTLVSANMHPEKSFFQKGFGIAIDINSLLKPFINPKGSPYLLEDYRLGFVKRGYLHGIINLQKYKIEAGSIIFITPGSIVEPLEASEDLQITGIGVSAEMFHVAHNGQLPDIFNGQLKHGIQKINENTIQLLNNLFILLWDIATERNSEFAKATDNIQGNATDDSNEFAGREMTNRQVVYNMLCTITSYYNTLFDQPQTHITSHRTANDIFDRFIYLVNNHCKEQRQLAFYAEKICITERYLGTVIRQTSGITAKEWIDRAVTTAAKVMLKHSNLQIVEIAERLHFPTASFFCKYFKRLEDCTPQEYRQTAIV